MYNSPLEPTFCSTNLREVSAYYSSLKDLCHKSVSQRSPSDSGPNQLVGQSPVSSERASITLTRFLVSLVFVYKVHTTLDNKPRIAYSPAFLYRYSQYASSDTLTTSWCQNFSVSLKEKPLPSKDEN